MFDRAHLHIQPRLVAIDVTVDHVHAIRLLDIGGYEWILDFMTGYRDAHS